MQRLDTDWEPLREDVEISPFDGEQGQDRYVVAVERRHFLVDAPTATLIEAWRSARSYPEVAERVSQRHGISLTASEVAALARDGLPRVLFEADSQRLKHPLILRLQLFQGKELLPLLRASAALLRPSLALVLSLVFLLALGGAVLQLSQTTTRPLALAEWGLAIGGVLLGSLIHELGHLSACQRHGARQDGMGVGFYWFMPSFYAEVHGAWRLPRLQRAAVDVGGLYFQALYLIPICLAVVLLDDPSLPAMVLSISALMMMHTLNPVLKFDGYWLLSDLTGTANLHARIAETGRQWVLALRSGLRLPPPQRRETVLFVVFCSLGLAFFTYMLLFFGRQSGHAAGSLLQAAHHGHWWSAALSLLAVLLLTTLAGLIGFRLARAVARVFAAPSQGSCTP